MYSSLALALAFSISAPGIKAAPKAENPSILGQWEVVEAVLEGKPEQAPPGGVTIHFKEDNTYAVFEGQMKEDESNFRIDYSKTPFEIELFPPPTSKEKPVFGICKIEEGKLVLCLAKNGFARPTQFVSTPNSNHMLMTFVRKKAK
jgi:uncharacterized protein (TIGR03067 family)